jgi:hypothetical protein
VNCKLANATTSALSAWISSTRISVLLLSVRARTHGHAVMMKWARCLSH